MNDLTLEIIPYDSLPATGNGKHLTLKAGGLELCLWNCASGTPEAHPSCDPVISFQNAHFELLTGP
jgi:hypothetical protein